MNKASRMIAIVLIVVLAFSITACGKSGTSADSSKSPDSSQAPSTDSSQAPSTASTDKKVLKIIVTAENHTFGDAFKTFVEDAKKDLPGFDIQLEEPPAPSIDYENKLRVQMSSGDLPDVWWDHGGSFAVPFLNAKILLPLENYMNDMKVWDNLITTQDMIKNNDGHVYGIPVENVSYQLILYNKDIFEKNGFKPAKTWSEFVDLTKAIKAKGITPIGIGAKDGWPASMFVETLAYSDDPDITKNIAAGKAKFSDAPYKNAATKTKQLLDLGAFAKDVAVQGWDQAHNNFYAGKTAMLSTLTMTISDAWTKMKGNVGFMYFPVDDASKYGTFAPGGVKKDANMFVSANTKYPKEAAKLALLAALAINKYYYEKQNNVAIPYKPDAFGWKLSGEVPPLLTQVMKDAVGFRGGDHYVQDIMTTSVAAKAVMDNSGSFFTNAVSVDDYLKAMDKGLEAK